MRRCIYIIINEENQDFKIGIGKDAHKRLKTLQTGNSDKLSLLYTREVEFASKVEKNLHKDYEFYRKEGEWFSPEANLSLSDFDNKVCKYESLFISLKDSGNPFL